ncbi:MAG: hypothetical protein ACF788_04275 [Novipirellula sp. JB048]
MAIVLTISLQESGLRAFFKTAKAASVDDVFGAAVLVPAGFFAMVAFVILAGGTTQLPLSRKHIQRCSGIRSWGDAPGYDEYRRWRTSAVGQRPSST